MGLRIRQRQRRAPRAAEYLPALDAQVLADTLDVRHQVPGGVAVQLRMWRGLAAATLVEQHDAVNRRVEEASAFRTGTAARTTMQEYHRLTLWITALLVIDRMQRRHRQEADIVSLDFRVQGATFDSWHEGSCSSRSTGRVKDG